MIKFEATKDYKYAYRDVIKVGYNFFTLYNYKSQAAPFMQNYFYTRVGFVGPGMEPRLDKVGNYIITNNAFITCYKQPIWYK